MTGEPIVSPARPLLMRRSFLLLVAAMLGLAVLPFPQVPASASCAGPYLDLGAKRLVLDRRATVTIEGRNFVDGCRDSMSCTVGCNSCEWEDPAPAPTENVRLRLVQGARTWNLDVADAESAESRFGRVTWSFDVPARATPGPAKLVADGVRPVRIRIR